MAVERFLTCCRARNSCCFSAMFEMPNLSKSLSMRLRSCPSVRCDSLSHSGWGRPAACSHCAAELSVAMASPASVQTRDGGREGAGLHQVWDAVGRAGAPWCQHSHWPTEFAQTRPFPAAMMHGAHAAAGHKPRAAASPRSHDALVLVNIDRHRPAPGWHSKPSVHHGCDSK